MRHAITIVFAAFLWTAGPASAEEKTSMTLERMGAMIEAIGDDVSHNSPGQWRFKIETVPVFVITDEAHDRMRILVGVSKTKDLSSALFERMMQANFDTTLDARYAVAKGVVWGAFLHPLKALTDRLFLSGVGQTVNLARTFGKTFSSGGLTFSGGDSRGIIERELIEKLIEKGLAI